MSKARNTSYLLCEYSKHMRGRVSPFFYQKLGKIRTKSGDKVSNEAVSGLYRKTQCGILPRGKVWFDVIKREFTMNYEGREL